MNGKYLVADCETKGPWALASHYGEPATFLWQGLTETGDYRVVESRSYAEWYLGDPCDETEPQVVTFGQKPGRWYIADPGIESQKFVYIDPRTCMEWAAWYVDDGGEGLQDFTDGIEDPDKEIIGFNTQFDFGHALKDGIGFPWMHHCVYSMAVTLVRDRKPLKLKELAERFLGEDPEEADGVKDWLRRNRKWFQEHVGRAPDYGDVPRPLMVQYGYQDVLKTLKLFWMWRKTILEDDDYRRVYWIDCMAQVTKGMLEGAGMHVDLDYCKREAAVMESRADMLEKELFQLVGRAFNPLSAAQVSDILFKQFGLRPLPEEVTKTGNPSTGKDSLAIYSTVYGDPRKAARLGLDQESAERIAKICKLLPIYRTCKKFNSTYFQPLQVLSSDRVMHYPYFIGVGRNRGSEGGTVTGRMSSPAHVNPKKKELDWAHEDDGIDKAAAVRGAFVPGPNETLIANDWQKMEIVFGERYFKSEQMIKTLAEGGDPYVAAAKMVFGPDTMVEEAKLEDYDGWALRRFIGKGLVLGIGYGIGPKKFARQCRVKGANIGREQAKEYITRYKSRSPGIPRMFVAVDRKVKERGWIRNAAGRKYFMQSTESYKGVNYLIQGGCSEIMKRAMIITTWALNKRLRVKSRLRASIHDEFISGIHDSDRDVSLWDCIYALDALSQDWDKAGTAHLSYGCASAANKLRELNTEWRTKHGQDYPFCGIPYLIRAVMCSFEDWLDILPLKVDGEMTRSRWSDMVDFDPEVLDNWMRTGCPATITVNTVAGQQLQDGLWSGAWSYGVTRPSFADRDGYRFAKKTTVGRLGLKALEQALIEVGGQGRKVHIVTADPNLLHCLNSRTPPGPRSEKLLKTVLRLLDRHEATWESRPHQVGGSNKALEAWEARGA